MRNYGEPWGTVINYGDYEEQRGTIRNYEEISGMMMYYQEPRGTIRNYEEL